MKIVLGLLLTSSYLNAALGGCVFGPNDLSQLALRNNTILSVMNDTLLNYTHFAEMAISKGSSFRLTDYLGQTYAVNVINYLSFVNMGKLLKINWTQATQTATVNGTFDGLKLDSYITKHYVEPVHTALQNLSEFFSFSVGIFRPKDTQFYFTGLATDPTGNSILDSTCYAGSSFVWRLSTSLPYDVAFDNHLGTKYANLATATECALDSYYRTKSILGGSFVRVDLKDATRRPDGSAYVVAYAEIFFLNESYDLSTVNRSTSLSQIMIEYQQEGSLSPISGTIYGPPYSYINSTLYAPSTTKTSTTVPTTTYTSTLSSTSTTESTELEASSTLPATSITTEISTSSLSTSTTQLFPIGSSSMLMPGLTTIALNSSITSTTSFSNMWISSSVNTTETTPTSLFTTLITMFPTQQSTLNTKETTMVVNNSNSTTATTQTMNFNNLTAAFASSTLNPASSSSINGINNITTNNNSLQSTMKLSSDYGVTAFNIFSNITMTTKVTYAINTTSNWAAPTASTRNYSTDGGTTYDPDPFFKARVPVVTKTGTVDDYLLRMKIGTMRPLMETKAFLMVTMPTIIGMLVLLACCLICWQIDCYIQAPETKKVSIA